MKTQVLILALLTTVFTIPMQAQNRTTINPMNSEISDNLDLRAVASIFGDSRNLQDFERRLNDPRLQISNLDLNYDNEVDYIRVIESVRKRTHVIILQSIIDRDLYQDIATIELEKDGYDNVSIQVVGNNYMYGANYIFEPVYYNTPHIYASLWLSNYHPYYSSWTWNYYPSYFYAWNPFSVFRYKNNINVCLNTYNDYNYVSYRRSSLAVNIYSSKRCNDYERLHPNNSFVRRNNDVSNRFELDKRRYSSTMGSRNNSPRVATPQREEPSRGYSQNKNDSPRVATPQREEPSRGYSQNRNDSPRVVTPQREEPSRGYSQNRNESQRATTPQREEPSRGYSQNRNESQSTSSPQREAPSRGYLQNRNDSSRSNPNEARNFSSREGNRRS